MRKFFLICCLTLIFPSLVFARCAGGTLTLPQILRAVKDRVMPYNLDEDTQGYLEDMIWARYLGEKDLFPIDDPEAKEMMKAVVSGDCSRFSSYKLNECLGLVKFNPSRFISGALRSLGDDMVEEKDLKLMYYIYVFYADAKRLEQYGKKDPLAAYVYLFLADTDCSCIAAKRVESWFSLVKVFLGKGTVPGKVQKIPKILKELVRNIDIATYYKFRKSYF